MNCLTGCFVLCLLTCLPTFATAAVLQALWRLAASAFDQFQRSRGCSAAPALRPLWRLSHSCARPLCPAHGRSGTPSSLALGPLRCLPSKIFCGGQTSAIGRSSIVTAFGCCHSSGWPLECLTSSCARPLCRWTALCAPWCSALSSALSLGLSSIWPPWHSHTCTAFTHPCMHRFICCTDLFLTHSLIHSFVYVPFASAHR